MFKIDIFLLGQPPDCRTIQSSSRRNLEAIHQPYIPRDNQTLYECDEVECWEVALESITEMLINTDFQSCYKGSTDIFFCDRILFDRFKTIDKLLFLSRNMNTKYFYAISCEMSPNMGRFLCYKNYKYAQAPGIENGKALSPDVFICEQEDTKITCIPNDPNINLNSFDIINLAILEGRVAANLKKTCEEGSCYFVGYMMPLRRSVSYEPPGNKMFRCYRAKGQQICKEIRPATKPYWI